MDSDAYRDRRKKLMTFCKASTWRGLSENSAEELDKYITDLEINEAIDALKNNKNLSPMAA